MVCFKSNPDEAYVALLIPLQLIGTGVGVLLPLSVMDKIKESLEPANGQIPKFYFQFWAFHLVMFGHIAYTISAGLRTDYVADFIFTVVHVIYGAALLPQLICLGCTSYDFNTPTHSFGGDCAHRAVMVVSVFLLFFFPYMLVNVSPSFVASLYHSPLQTLVWCVLAFTATLYINALLALLLFQLERCSLVSSGRSKARIGRERKRLDSHVKFYSQYCESSAYVTRPMLCIADWNSMSGCSCSILCIGSVTIVWTMDHPSGHPGTALWILALSGCVKRKS